jgi:hypothetical protein
MLGVEEVDSIAVVEEVAELVVGAEEVDSIAVVEEVAEEQLAVEKEQLVLWMGRHRMGRICQLPLFLFHNSYKKAFSHFLFKLIHL